MKKFIVSIFFFIVVIVLSVVTVYGSLTPDNAPVKTVGPMQVAAYRNGLSIFQSNRGQYYTFSPYNDYIVSPGGVRSSLISQSEIDEGKFTINLHTSHFADISKAILSYIDQAYPEIKYKTEDKTIDYGSEIEDRSLVITKKLTLNGQNFTGILGSTMNYYGIDYIFDKSLNLYTYQSEEDINQFKNIFELKLIPSYEKARTAVDRKAIAVVSPYIHGVIVIRANANQNIYINRETKLIEIEDSAENQSNSFTTGIKIEVYENPTEAWEAL